MAFNIKQGVTDHRIPRILKGCLNKFSGQNKSERESRSVQTLALALLSTPVRSYRI